jgi:pilus assembly protein CpaE
MKALSAGLVIATPRLLDEVRGALRTLPVSVVLAEAATGNVAGLLEKVAQARPDVVFVELFGSTASAEEVVRPLKAAQGAPAVFAIQETAEAETIVAAMRAGADEYLYPPFGPRLEEALERVAHRRSAGNQLSRRGKTLAFFSAKGGCGATTIACHVAAEFQRQTEQKILLADLDMDAGLVRFFIKAKSPYSVSDAALNRERLDPSFWWTPARFWPK